MSETRVKRTQPAPHSIFQRALCRYCGRYISKHPGVMSWFHEGDSGDYCEAEDAY